MNIFLTSPSPQDCAESLDDRRVVKMVLETAQLLSTACHVLAPGVTGLYKQTHVNHPCSLFARQTGANFRRLVAHGVSLATEYSHRFGRLHASLDVIYHAANVGSRLAEARGFDGPLDFSFNCSGQSTGDLFADYRRCMNLKWVDSGPKWTRRGAPKWYGEA